MSAVDLVRCLRCWVSPGADCVRVEGIDPSTGEPDAPRGWANQKGKPRRVHAQRLWFELGLDHDPGDEDRR